MRNTFERSLNLHRLAWCALLLLWSAVSPASDDLGLLLGIRKGAIYRTLFVRFSGDRCSLVASGDDLVVPRQSGFWQLRVVTAIGGKNRQISEQLIQAGPAVTQFIEPTVDPEEEKYCDSANPPRESGSRVILLFVGNDYIAQRYEWWSDCGARPTSGSRLLVKSIDQLNTPGVSIEELIGPEGLHALQQGASAFLDTIPPGDRDGYDRAYGIDWGLLRTVGGWRLIGHLGPAYSSARSANTEFEIALSPPETLVGEGVPSRLLDLVRKEVPNTSDLFLAPDGSHVVVLTPETLHVYLVRDGVLAPDPVLLTHPEFEAIDTVVMVQWSVGRHVSRWTEEIGNLLQKE